nr:hypothetical protein [uncultured Albidiferax sp.]
MPLFARSLLLSRTALLMEQAYTPPAIAIATALLMSLLIGLLWSLGWVLGAGLVLGSFYVSLGLLRPTPLERIAGSLAVSGLVIASGVLFGSMAAALAGFILLLPLGLAALGVEDA